MKKSHIISLFSFILSVSFYFIGSLLRRIGIFMLRIPENLHDKLGVEKEFFSQSLSTLFHRSTDYEIIWNFTIGGTHYLFIYFSILFALIGLISLVLSFKKVKS